MAVVMMFGRWLFVLMQECQHSDIRMFAAMLPTCPTFVSYAFFFSEVGRLPNA